MQSNHDNETLRYHKAIGKKVIYNKGYPAAGECTFMNGSQGSLTYSDGRWQGFLSNVDVTIDLGKVQDISYVSITFMQLTGPSVYIPGSKISPFILRTRPVT